MKPFATIAVGLTLAAGVAAAQAQTVTRQITSEPVETVLTQTPNGTAVTRRILTPEPGFTTYGVPAYDQPPLAATALAPDYVGPAATFTTRRVITSRPAVVTSRATTVGVAERTQVTTRKVIPRATAPVRTVVRTVVRPVFVPPPPSDLPLVLSPEQRQIVYRTIVRRDLYPAPAVAPWPPVVAQTELVAPATYPLRTIYPADSGYVDYGYRDEGYRYSSYAYEPSYRDRYVYRWDGVPLVVGARIPPSVPLVAVPDWVAARIPAARPYSYAVLDNRVYLVDPATAIIVAEIAP